MVVTLHPRLKRQLSDLLITLMFLRPDERDDMERLLTLLATPKDETPQLPGVHILGCSVALLGATYKGKQYKRNKTRPRRRLETTGTDTGPLYDWVIQEPEE